MLGYLLARSGVAVTVLEKHPDFNRDFRGDTVHPSTLEVMHELGLLDGLLAIPHQELSFIGGVFGDFSFRAADLRHLPTRCKFVALMPQWDFLNFLSEQARRFPDFQLRMQHEAVDLIRDGNRINGVKVKTPGGPAEIRADLVIGCDGRHSITRQAAQLEVIDYGVPIDVLWFRLSRRERDPEQLLGNVNYGKVLILLNRGDYFQAGLLIQKGSFDEVQSRGLESFRESARRTAPYLGDRLEDLKNWDQIKLLSVQINRLRQWYRPGLLCLGDAAHAMSPAWGVGINLAIQDAVAAANLLTDSLREGRVTEAILARVQRRREFPTLVTQQLQVLAHKQLWRVFQMTGPAKAPWQFKLVVQIPGIQQITGRMIGMGIRPEHVDGARKVSCPVPRRIRRMVVGVGAATAVFVMSLLRGTRPRYVSAA
jgi:2-polyprenyl-6-methoxyphenol hydroxylase-like FAD-dependent oxidoreductase